MIFRLFDWIKISVGAVVGAVIGYQVGHWRGYAAAYDKWIADAAVEAVKADAERRGDDAKLQNMSDYDLCVAGLRASRVSVEVCEALR